MSKWIYNTTPVHTYFTRHALERDAAIDAALTWLTAYENIDGNGDESAFAAYMSAEETLASALRPLAARAAVEGIDVGDELP